jgi:putative transposase
MRVRAYRFRAYTSKTTARVLKTQLEVACKLYNALLHAEQEEYEENKRTMSMNELRQLALDLRKQNKEFQALHSQVAQQVAERFYEARQRFFEGLANKPKKKKPHQYLSLVYPQSGWRLSNTREVGRGKNKKKRKARLRLSKIGFFTLILHREFPESQVSQVCVKLYPSGRIHVIFLVEEPEAQEEQPSEGEPKNAVGVDLGITRLATLSDGRYLENPRPLERSLERIRMLQRSLSRKRFLSGNWLKTKTRLAEQHERVKDFRRDLFFKLGALLSQEYDVLVLEDLNVQGLIQKGETRKRRLRLYDSSFSEIRRILEWEFVKRGKLALPVPSYNSSRECFLCGRINQNLSLEDRVFHCPYCGFTLDRDLNASLVLLKRAGWVPPGVPVFELRPLPPPPSLGLKKRRQGGAMRQEDPVRKGGVVHLIVFLVWLLIENLSVFWPPAT